MATATRTKNQTTNGKGKPPLALSRAVRPSKPQPVRWTSKQYHAMADKGWFQDRRVELIGGQIFEVEKLNPPSWVSMGVSEERLREVFTQNCIITTRMPLKLSSDSEPEPDIAVVRGTPHQFIKGLPTTALLIVEISDSTLRFDRTTKASLYAAAGIEDYWIVNLKARKLEVHRTPVEHAKAKFGWIYEHKTEFKENDTVSPLAAPEASIKVADLLP